MASRTACGSESSPSAMRQTLAPGRRSRHHGCCRADTLAALLMGAMDQQQAVTGCGHGRVQCSLGATWEVFMSGGMGQRGHRRQISAVAGATLFLLLGLGVVWFASKVADVHDGAVLAAFVIVPALLY